MHQVETPSGTAVPCHEIHFQCVVDLGSGAVIGYEALARFEDGRPPQEHLAQARDEGRRLELELALLRSAVTAASAIPAQFTVSVNASAETIDSPEIEGLLPADRTWGLELAETSRPEADDRLRRRAHDLGVLLMIDDAGVAHATTEWVTALHPVVVKVDRRVIQAACDDDSARCELDAFVAAARAVHARTVAEGVETETHARVAAEAGIDYAQGFRYGHPAPFRG